MASIITMPKQGLLMEEGKLTKWLKKEGEEVREGEQLFEMETDKLTITMDSTASGTLLKILHPEGDNVPVTQPIAIVGEKGESIEDLLPKEQAAAEEVPQEAAPSAKETKAPEVQVSGVVQEGRCFSSPRARFRAEEKKVDITKVPGTGPEGIVVEKDVLAYAQNHNADMTHLAKLMAEKEGVDTGNIEGTGIGGRICGADIRRQMAGRKAVAAGSPERGVRREAMNGMRKAVMRNMLNSKETNAQTFVRMSVNMAEVIRVREALKKKEIKVSYNDIIIRAAALALLNNPVCNASVDGTDIVYHDYVNVGLAVSAGEGLLVPVVKDADLLSLQGIAQVNAGNIEKARSGKLSMEDMTGGTFTVSALGSFGVDEFVAIINTPESCILAVSSIVKTPVVVTENGEDKVVIEPRCNLALSYDHRIINGVDAAKLLGEIKNNLENPSLML